MSRRRTQQKKLTEEEILADWEQHPMRRPRIASVAINFAVGQSGPELEKARTLCEQLTDQKPAEAYAKKSIRGFNIRKGEPIGIKTTLRGEKAVVFLKKIIWAKEDKLLRKSFDRNGNIAIGVREHLDLPKIRYDPKIGVQGFTATVVLERPGYRVKRRRYRPHRIPESHQLTPEEAIVFFKQNFKVEIV